VRQRGEEQQWARCERKARAQDQMLRLKASLERCKRLTDDYAQVMLDTFASAALQVGRALGVPGEVQTVFTESEIRRG